MSNTTDTGMDSGAETDVSVDSALTEAFAEITAANADTHSDTPPARLDAAPARGDQNPPETPAAGADKAPATPDRWSAEEQAQFAALPPEAKALVESKIAAIEADYSSKAQETAASVELAQGIRSIVDENGFRETLQQSGMNEVEGVRYLANLERFAREKPVDYLKFVADHVRDRFGIDPAKVLGLTGQPSADPNPDEAFQDPRVATLQADLNRVTTQLQQDAQRRALDTAGQQIAGVRDAKDASGQPLRPHFADVENDMAALVRANPKMTLEQAYDAAVWSNPAVRTKLQAAERDAAEKKARDEAATAQRAIRSNVRPGTRNMAPSQAVDSVDDAVSQAFAEINR